MDRPTDKKHKKKKTWGRKVFLVILFFIACIITGMVKRHYQEPLQRKPSNAQDAQWSSQSFGFAPHPDDHDDPVIQIYAARTWGAKKALAVHTWIATKRKGADHYRVSQVIGWRLRYSGTSVSTSYDIPDKGWYGNEPILLKDLRGPELEKVIDKVDQAVEDYPWRDEYTIWPGPNSNTFVSWVGIQVPELQLDLPSTAIGKDWRPLNQTFGLSSSGTGVQASFWGLLGTTFALEEGVEVNILGLSVELDLFDLAIELPGIGRIGQDAVEGS